MKERYGDDPLINPDLNMNLWLEARLSGGPDRNLVCGLSNTTIEDLRTTHNVSTSGCSRSILST
jgi:hypothetical protein